MSVTSARRGSTSTTDPAKTANELAYLKFSNATDSQIYQALNDIFALFESEATDKGTLKAERHIVTVLKNLMKDLGPLASADLVNDPSVQNALYILKQLSTKKEHMSVSDLSKSDWNNVKTTILQAMKTSRDGAKNFYDQNVLAPQRRAAAWGPLGTMDTPNPFASIDRMDSGSKALLALGGGVGLGLLGL